MKEVTKDFGCPMLGNNHWDAECELISHYFCPVAAIPFMDIAILNDYPECPYSWQVEEK